VKKANRITPVAFFRTCKETLIYPLPDETARSQPIQEEASLGQLHPKQALFSVSVKNSF